VRIPEILRYPPIRQGAVVLRSSKNQKAVRDFLEFETARIAQVAQADFGL
jgi:hypothetical protein